MLVEVPLADVHPPFDGLPVDLHVELEAPRGGADPERLIAGRIAGEQHRIRGHLEVVVVPFEPAVALAERPQQRVCLAVGQEADVEPALLRGGRADATARRAREDLAAEAHAEHRQLALEALAQEP